MIAHYLSGRWRTPVDEGTAYHDAATGAETFRVSTVPVDLAEALGHARSTGGPALRALDLEERAGQLKKLARLLVQNRAGIVELAGSLGATPADAGHDIDGGIRALRRYVGVLSRELPSAPPVWGGADSVTRDGSVMAQSLGVDRPGVALHIDGFSLPVRTVLEKVGRSYLAGMPSVLRPSGRTARLVAKLVERIAEAGILPDGALQLLSGPVELPDCFTSQDLISFTGTRATARRLRGRIAKLSREPRTDLVSESLNCAVLGPDGGPGTAAFHLFVDRLAAAMVAHTGQTSAAVRRAFVPARWLDDVAEATAAALAGVRTGHPASPGTQMGPLIDQAHRRAVRDSVQRLTGAARTVLGPASRAAQTADDDLGPGAFMSPVLLAAREGADHQPLHEVEAFGPVSALIPYRTHDDISVGLALGRSGLDSWVVTADPEAARTLTRALAPWHSRLRVVDPVLPPATETGAGEVEFLRRLRADLAEVRVEASPRLAGAITGRWVRGAERTVTETHPLRRHLGELRVGDSLVAGPRTVTRADIDRFTELTGDRFYAHTDVAATAGAGPFGGIVAHGSLVIALATGLFVTPEPGPALANHGLDHLRFLAPVRPGDELTVTLTAKEIRARAEADHGEVRWEVEVVNQHGLPVVRYDLLLLTARTSATRLFTTR